MPRSKRTILVLGDQLTHHNTALKAAEPGKDRVLMAETRDGGPRTHRIKRVFQFSAMRHFAAELRAKGWDVDYVPMERAPDLPAVLARHFSESRPGELLAMEPNNFSQRENLRSACTAAGVELRELPTCQFVVPRAEFEKFAAGKKRLLMENHYRAARLKLGVLVDAEGNPEGGAWNFDAENRKTVADWKRDGAPRPPKAPTLARPRDAVVDEVAAGVREWFPEGAGRAEDCWLPVTRKGALAALREFVEARLQRFGDYQDLMLEDSPTMFHSLIAGPLNLGLLLPMECVEAAVDAYRAGKAPLAAVEGFTRQIIGWREFVNGVYWLKMPGYLASNGLGANRPLPGFFYTGGTDMNCLRCSIGEALGTAFNHHIQRLMVLGNFCLLAGISPQAAHDWFLEMYIDAHEWVMAANVLGMALHADGGFMATKPYAGSAAYISKMSNYCAGCAYDPAKKSGPGACPFNLLYWDFYDRHTARFGNNPRTGMMVKSWLKRPEPEKEAIRKGAAAFLEKLA
jgi:deoxyribodipyrimidine photolyase-related protein